MPDDSIGSIDGLEVRLATNVPPEDRYRRNYVPVTPKSQEIAGADAAIAPESTIATWAIDGWSAGEGDLRWRDVDRYNESSGMAPASNGSGLVVGPKEERTQYSGSDFSKFREFDVGRGIYPNLYAASTVDDNVYKWDFSNEYWSVFYAIGGSSGNVSSIAAASAGTVFVTDGTDLYKVTAASNANHYPSSAFDALGFFGATLYGLANDSKLYSIDQTTTSTRTEEYDPDYGGNSPWNEPLAMSDVGPIFITPTGQLHEFNQADSTGRIVGVLPIGATPSRPFWARDSYYVPFALRDNWTVLGAYLWYKSPVGEGVIGPLRSDPTDGYIYIQGMWGDRIVFTMDGSLWAYDTTDGAVVHLKNLTYGSNIGGRPGIIRSASAFIRGNGFVADRIILHENHTDSATLRTGRYDFGYLGLNKILTKVTITAEQPLGAGDVVNLEYSTDGDTFYPIAGSMVTGETSKTWHASTSAETISGVDFEFRIGMTAGTSSSDIKIVSVVAEAIGAESRIEWILAVDVSTNNVQNGQVVLEGLKALKESPTVNEFVDPWQQLDWEPPEQFDVTVEDVSTPFEQPGGKRFAVVKLRATETVGLVSPVTSSVVQPGSISASTSVPAPSILQGDAVAPSTVSTSVTVPTPTVATSGEASEMPVSYLSSNTTLSTQGIYVVDTDSANIVITLPDLSTIGTDGIELVVIRDGSNYLYVVGNGTDTYWDTTSQKTIFDDFGAVAVVAHDTDDEWHELGRFRTVT